MFENVEIRDMQTLCIDMADVYVTVVYAGTVDHVKQFMISTVSVTEGGADLTSTLHSVDDMKERLQDLSLGRPHPVIDEYLKNK